MNKSVDMLKGNIKVVLIAIAWPIVLSNLIQTAMGLVDMIWIGKLGSNAVTAIGTASFFIQFAQAFAALIITGTGVLVAQSIGRKQKIETKIYIKNGIILSLLISSIFTFIVFVFAKPLIGFFNLEDPLLIKTTIDYLRHSLVGVPFLFLVATYVSILTSFGQTKLTFRANAIGLFLNIILDPIFIFGFGLFPSLGVIGAAWATNLSRMLIFYLLYKNSKKEISLNNQVDFNFDKVKEVIKMGLPVTLQRVLFILISMVMARIVVRFGTDAIAAQRIGIQIESISYVTIGGLQGAIAAFIGQNYGNNNIDRIEKGFYMALKLVFILGSVISALFIFFPKQIFTIFIQDPTVVKIGVDYMVAIGYSQLFMCIELLVVGAFNGLGKTKIPAFVTTVLTFLRIPMSLLLVKSLAVNGVWWSISITSVFKGIVLLVWFYIYLKKFKNNDTLGAI